MTRNELKESLCGGSSAEIPALFPELFAEIGEITTEPKSPLRPDWWIVIGVYGNRGRWHVPFSLAGRTWSQQAAAKAAAKRLSKGWHHIRIVRIPGEAGTI